MKAKGKKFQRIMPKVPRGDIVRQGAATALKLSRKHFSDKLGPRMVSHLEALPPKYRPARKKG